MKSNIIFIDENSQVSFTNSFIDNLVNINFIIKENSCVNYFFDQINFKDKNQNLTFNFYIYKNSKLNFNFKISDAFSTNLTLNSFLVGQNSIVNIKGSYLLDGSKQVNITSKQQHLAQNTKSEVVIRGALFENSSSNYTGEIYIDPKGVGSIAVQENKNILFSDLARAISVPSLEALTDEVKCSHACAVGYFDKEYLFYMQSRGLNQERAQQLLLESFLV